MFRSGTKSYTQTEGARDLGSFHGLLAGSIEVQRYMTGALAARLAWPARCPHTRFPRPAVVLWYTGEKFIIIIADSSQPPAQKSTPPREPATILVREPPSYSSVTHFRPPSPPNPPTSRHCAIDGHSLRDNTHPNKQKPKCSAPPPSLPPAWPVPPSPPPSALASPVPLPLSPPSPRSLPSRPSGFTALVGTSRRMRSLAGLRRC